MSQKLVLPRVMACTPWGTHTSEPGLDNTVQLLIMDSAKRDALPYIGVLGGFITGCNCSMLYCSKKAKGYDCFCSL